MKHPAPEPPGPRLALVVATSTYADPALTQLRAPAQDAAAVADVLADPRIGGFTLTTVLDRSEAEIRRAINTFLTGRHRDDLVVIYLSCHGLQDKRGRLYFAATDTIKTELAATAVESAWLLDRLEECRARRQVLILDCCFSGSFAHTKGVGGADLELDRVLIGAGRGRAVLTASRAGEYSYEGAALPSAITGRSVFTAALVDGLRTGAADSDGDGYITIDEAYTYAADQVAAAGGAQSPQRWLYGAEGQIILARNPHGATVNPAKLPEAVQMALDSPYPDIRLGAVAAVGAWLTSDDAGEIMTAQQILQRVASQDSPLVATKARLLLQATEPETSTRGNPALPTRTASRLPLTIDRPANEAPAYHCARILKKGRDAFLSGVGGIVVFSPDGHLLATASKKTLQLWNPATGEAIGHPLIGHTGTVRAAAFSPDGHLLATGSEDGTVQLWNPATCEAVGHSLTGHTGWVRGVSFSPDGHLLASLSSHATIRLWNPAAREAIDHPLTQHLRGVLGAAFSPDGRLIASIHENTVQLWSAVPGGAIDQPLILHTGRARAVAFSPDGHLLATASTDGAVRLWNPATGEAIGHPLTGHTGWVWAVRFSPDGHLLATASTDGTVRLWNPATGEVIGHPLTGHTGKVQAAAFSPDGRLLATANKKTVQLWNPATGEAIGHPLTGHTRTVQALTFSPDGHLLATASTDGTVRLWRQSSP
ncbi:caspase, EACC1-associated type [Actinomadura litoris]|uniref:caspase, EACC1-associated type n=1 Tax=Actinomadura litoris TaxID=2678616 RepID=UPI001FA7451B|nr:caspase family protein [Actinomadura litoris]